VIVSKQAEAAEVTRSAYKKFLTHPSTALSEKQYRRSAIVGGVARTRASSLLRTARQRSGLTQIELAARAGVTQSVISAYESGHRQPSLSTLSGLIAATGLELDVRVRRAPARLAKLNGPVGRRVRRHKDDLIEAAAAHGVTNLRIFGSVARGADRPDSDVDLLADLPPGLGLIGLGRVIAELEAILGARVDLIPASDLKHDIRDRVQADLIAL
jgi:predicted nucleotidyltransferase/ribosome-binding protein aMBF1 (putative translation factor)